MRVTASPHQRPDTDSAGCRQPQVEGVFFTANSRKGLIMKTLLVVAALLLVGIGGVGFYRGWLRLSTERHGRRSPRATFTVDKDKIRADGGSRPKETVQGLGQEVKEDAGDPTEKVAP